jgi:hypothetical protein
MAKFETKGASMSKIRLAVVAAVPLLWAAAAAAQMPPGEADRPPGPWMGHHPVDHATMCADAYAQTAAHLAYVEAKLDLTEQQRPLFAKLRQVTIDSAAKERAVCLESVPKGAQPPNTLEREAHLEKILTAKLQQLQAARPALQALYDSLSPAQREIFDHQGRFGEHGRGGGGEEPHGMHGKAGMESGPH